MSPFPSQHSADHAAAEAGLGCVLRLVAPAVASLALLVVPLPFADRGAPASTTTAALAARGGPEAPPELTSPYARVERVPRRVAYLTEVSRPARRVERPTGGVALANGFDDDADGRLDPGEVDELAVVCATPLALAEP